MDYFHGPFPERGYNSSPTLTNNLYSSIFNVKIPCNVKDNEQNFIKRKKKTENGIIRFLKRKSSLLFNKTLHIGRALNIGHICKRFFLILEICL